MTRTGPAAPALPAIVVATLLWLVAACATGSSVGTPRVTGSPSAVAPTTAAATGTPPATASLTPPPTATAATPTAATPSATPAGVPMGTLSVGSELGDAVPGWLGSYCWNNGCVDVGQVPAMDDLPLVDATGADELTFDISTLAGVFYDWHVDYVGDGGHPKPLASGDAFDPDAGGTHAPMRENVTFAAPPAGDWTLTVAIHFVFNGDAVYGWHVKV